MQLRTYRRALCAALACVVTACARAANDGNDARAHETDSPVVSGGARALPPDQMPTAQPSRRSEMPVAPGDTGAARMPVSGGGRPPGPEGSSEGSPEQGTDSAGRRRWNPLPGMSRPPERRPRAALPFDPPKAEPRDTSKDTASRPPR